MPKAKKPTKHIEKRGDKWCVVSHRTGRSLGCYDTHAEAIARLRHLQGYSAPEGALFYGMSDGELETLLAKLNAKAANTEDTSHEDPPRPPAGKPKNADTLYIAPLLVQQIMSYQRKLLREFNKGIDKLTLAAEKSDPEQAGKDVIAEMQTAFLGLAPTFFKRTYNIGADFAAGFLGGSQLTEREAAANIQALVDKNSFFVSDRLMAEVTERYKLALGLTTDKMLTEVDGIAEALGARVGMYSLQLWGAGHKGFTDEAQAANKMIDWVLTSGNPCPDCPVLEDGSPYGPDNPLPTFPGAGDTECLTNCLCLLRFHAGEGKAAGGLVVAHTGGGALARAHEEKLLAALQHANGIALEQVKALKAQLVATKEEAAAAADRHEQALRSQAHLAAESAGLREDLNKVGLLVGAQRDELAGLKEKMASVEVRLTKAETRKRKVVKKVVRDSAGFATGSVEEEVDG